MVSTKLFPYKQPRLTRSCNLKPFPLWTINVIEQKGLVGLDILIEGSSMNKFFS